MLINITGEGYMFQIADSERKITFHANNIIAAKEIYLKRISDKIDDAIDESLWRLRKLEK